MQLICHLPRVSTYGQLVLLSGDDVINCRNVMEQEMKLKFRGIRILISFRGCYYSPALSEFELNVKDMI